MRLRTPDVAKAIQTTGLVQMELQNAQVHGNSAAERQNSFLTWCDNWARPQLGNHFLRTESIFNELDVNYDRIAFAPRMTERMLNGLLNREFKAWDAQLQSVLAELEVLQVFLGRPGRLMALDTSAFMEGPLFTTFRWHGLRDVPADSAIRLVVPALVIEELDDLKRHRDNRQKAKARQVLTTLWDLHRPSPTEPTPLPDQPDVTIEVLLDGDWHQRRPNNDGEIIDQVVMVSELTAQSVTLVSGDYTQLYRAAAAGLQAILMPRPDQEPGGNSA